MRFYAMPSTMGRPVANHPLPVRVEPELKQYPHYDHKSRECFLNLERAHVVVRPLFERLFRRHGLSGSTFNILMILRGAASPMAPFAIGERIVVTRATVTGLLDSLESKRLIRRDPDPADGRRLLISLTKSGSELVESLMPDVFALQQVIFAGLSADEKETLIALLGKVEAAAEGGLAKRAARHPDKRPAQPALLEGRNGYVGESTGPSRESRPRRLSPRSA